MTGRAALVTGAAKGIGRAAALHLAARGFAVAVNDRVMDDDLASAVDEIKKSGASAVAVPFDVADTACHDEALQKAESELGELTTLVNNAGVSVMDRGDMLDVSSESYDRCMDVNARAMFFLCQAFARRLVGRGRDAAVFHSVINVTSANADAVALPRTEYCASKAAAAMITKTLAARLGGENIHVYDVRPGLIATDMTKKVIKDYERRARDEGLTLLPRVGTADEMGRIIANLADGALPYTTGQVIAADAGMLVPRF